MTPERYNRITQVLKKRQPDLTVITDEVHKQRNLAAIIRNCDAVGIDQVHCAMPEMGYQIYSGTSASAQKWVDVLHYSEVQEPINLLKARGFQILAANLTEDAVDYRKVDYTVPTALVMGAEVKGVSGQSQAAADYNIVLPMYGMVESYNVSVACALILAEAQRQRDAAGLYDTVRLSQDEYDKRFFRWAHPTLASYCDERNIPYPPVRDDGEVEALSQWYKTVQSSD
ncbi:tRNA (guanosine(18)-2'-O)-methyltransferase [Thalassocella blandensis]|nr:tRNA (guanosine(18)-2'-O)-methyltransferase [Thalassocella blandensis]